jgi:hypothetical protein
MPASTTKYGRSARARATRRLWHQLLCLSAASVALSGVLLLVGDGLASANSGSIVANGASVTPTISTAGQASTWTFSGTSGEVVTSTVTAGTFANACDVNLQLLDQNGGLVSSTNCVGTSGFLGQTTLPGAGTYSLKLVPTDNDLGHVTLFLASNPAIGTITANGAPVTFTAGANGQGQEYSFTGKKVETVTVSAYNGTYPSNCDLQMLLLDSNGTTLASGGCASSSTFIGDTTLEGKGTYFIALVPLGQDLGNTSGKQVTISLSSNVANAPITENGTPATFATTSTGQGGNLTFSGMAGQVVTVSSFGGTYPGNCDLTMLLENSAGTVLGDAGCSSTNGFIGETTLAGTGTYTIVMQPLGQNIGTATGSVKVALSTEPANAVITENGPTVTFTASHTGQGRNYTFKGKAGQVVTVSTFGGTFPSNCDLEVLLVNQSGTVLGNGGCASQSSFIGNTVLPAKGNYAIELVPQGQTIGTSTGSVNLALSLNPSTGSIAENGSPVIFTSTHTGQGQDFTFSGTAGQTVSVTTSGGTFPANCDLNLQVLSPNGTAIGNGNCAAQSDTLTGVVLPGTGTYTIVLAPTPTNIGTNTGSVSIDLTA